MSSKVSIDRELLENLIQMAANDEPHSASYAEYQAGLITRANAALAAEQEGQE